MPADLYSPGRSRVLGREERTQICPPRVAKQTTTSGCFTFSLSAASGNKHRFSVTWSLPENVHGDMLAELSGYSIDDAVRRFLEDLQQGHLVIAIASINGAVRDVYIKDDPEERDRFKPENEVILLRYWDGTPYTPGSSNHRWHL